MSRDLSDAERALLDYLLETMPAAQRREAVYHWRHMAAGDPDWREQIAQLIERSGEGEADE